MTARLFWISGRVQGVGYRAFARREAEGLGIRGYARNLADGRVEVLGIGTEAALDDFSGRLRQGPPWGHVRGVETRESAMLNYEGFTVR